MENIKRQLWTAEEINVLTQFYSTEGVEYCNKLLPNRTINSIKLKAQRLGLKDDRYWSSEELSILLEQYPLVGGYICASLLPKRTYFSVQMKASQLGIKAKSRMKTHSEYEDELFLIQSDSYPLEEYKGATTPILHTCIEDHKWEAAPSDILKGRNCPECAIYGFNPGKPAILYYIKISHLDNIFYKIGVTNRTIEERFSLDKEKVIEILNIIHYETGLEAKEAEKEILNKYKEHRVFKKNFLKSGGNTELFNIDIFSL